MKTVIFIPARYASSRFPGKPLAQLRDFKGISKPLIQRSWEAAKAVGGVDAVYVTTDDIRIHDVSVGFGAEVIMTSEACENGTMRCADALTKNDIEAEIIINLQGDAPLTPRWFVEALIKRMQTDPTLFVVTPVVRCNAEAYAHFVSDRRGGRVGGTTAVFSSTGTALYFSKEVIPYIDPAKQSEAHQHVFHHVGLYGYRPDALERYSKLSAGPLETLEGLEQLRFIENGIPITCVEVEAHDATFWELNNPEDIPRIESILARE